MTRKLHTVYKVKSKKLIDFYGKYVVYKKEYGLVQPTYYQTKKQAQRDRNWVTDGYEYWYQ